MPRGAAGRPGRAGRVKRRASSTSSQGSSRSLPGTSRKVMRPPPRTISTGTASSARTRACASPMKRRVRALEAVQVEMVRDGGRMTFREVPGSEREMPCELVLLAMGFTGPERPGMLADLGVKLTERGNVWRDATWMTSVPGVFTAGDMQRGQSLIVWALAEGRSAARGVDAFLMGGSDLPAPLA